MPINSMTPHNPQQSVLAHWHHETVCKCGPRSAAQCEAQMMDNCLKTLSTPTISRQDTYIEPLAENAPAAHDGVTPKATRLDRSNDMATRQGQIRGSAHISALNPLA